MKMIDKHEILADYEDERLKITGVFDKFSFVTMNYREIKTALLQDVYAHVDGKDVDLGHVWLQNADPLKSLDLGFGDRIQCNCRVKLYKKRLFVPNKQGLMVENKFSLAWPTDVEVISRSKSPTDNKSEPPVMPLPQIVLPQPVVPSTDVPQQMSPAKAVSEIRRVAQVFGGWDSLQELIDAVRPPA
jgi:hypothetical protein